MGYMRDHAIVVASWNSDDIQAARRLAEAVGLGDLATPIVARRMNGGGSFAILPDGSKEGWIDSDIGDSQREEFVRCIRKMCHGDGSSNLDWVEVQFADDERETKVVRDGDHQEAAHD